ncbi:MAG: thioredoxin [bacterium]|nr:thioredoxin [bacterium]
MSAELHITDQDFDQKVLQSEKPVLVDFWAPWCGPCLMLGPVIEEVAKEIGEKAEVYKLNVDENMETAQKYGISSIPALIFFKGGQEAEKMIGVQQKDTLLKKLEELVK